MACQSATNSPPSLITSRCRPTHDSAPIQAARNGGTGTLERYLKPSGGYRSGIEAALRAGSMRLHPVIFLREWEVKVTTVLYLNTRGFCLDSQGITGVHAYRPVSPIRWHAECYTFQRNQQSGQFPPGPSQHSQSHFLMPINESRWLRPPASSFLQDMQRNYRMGLWAMRSPSSASRFTRASTNSHPAPTPVGRRICTTQRSLVAPTPHQAAGSGED